jgi:hypothetical protein
MVTYHLQIIPALLTNVPTAVTASSSTYVCKIASIEVLIAPVRLADDELKCRRCLADAVIFILTIDTVPDVDISQLFFLPPTYFAPLHFLISQCCN